LKEVPTRLNGCVRSNDVSQSVVVVIPPTLDSYSDVIFYRAIAISEGLKG